MATQKDNYKTPEKPKVKVEKDGPYVVSGGLPLSEQNIVVDAEGQSHGWKEGKKFPVQDNYSLCRCGRSKNKPFCDDRHIEARFDGKETASNVPYIEQAEVTAGPELKLTDAEKFCTNARFCERAGSIWVLTEQSSDPEARKTAIEEGADCPSGRLITWDRSGKPIAPHFEPSIGLIYDTQNDKPGAVWVRGGIPVESADGKTYEIRNKETLCRCGKSSNKPFCDGSHLR